jgi:hypothetical protein
LNHLTEPLAIAGYPSGTSRKMRQKTVSRGARLADHSI